MAWKVSSCSSGDTGSAARSMMSNCERVFSGPWGKRGGQGYEVIDPEPGWSLPPPPQKAPSPRPDWECLP